VERPFFYLQRKYKSRNGFFHKNVREKKMKTLFYFAASLTLLMSASTSLLAQKLGSFGPDTSTYRLGIDSTYTRSAYIQSSSNLFTGKTRVGSYHSNSIPISERGFYQWNIPDSLVPAGSTVDTVQIHIELYYPGPPAPTVFAVRFYDCSSADLSNPNLTYLWSVSQGGYIASETTTTLILDRSYSGPTDLVRRQVQAGLSSHRFILGIQYSNEGPANDSVFQLQNSKVKLRVVFTYPTKSVIVDQQIVSKTTSIDSVGNWEVNRFATYKAPHTFSFFQTDTVTLRATQKLLTNIYKYKNWSTDNNVVNPKAFTIFSGTTRLISSVDTVQNATIQSQFLDGGNPGGSLNFQDPWLMDSVDQKHGNSAINRGMSAGFNSVAYASNNLGMSTSYKGVFLKMYPPSDTSHPSYYSLRAPLTQTNINGLTGYFQNWITSNAALSQVGSNPSGYDQKAVVFTGNNATVTARYKGHLVSSISQASGYNSQRTLFVDPAGWYNLVYESAGEIWFTYSSDGGHTWSQDTRISAGRGTAHNPSICQLSSGTASNFVYLLWTDVAGNGSGYSVYALSYEWSYHTWYPNTSPEEIYGVPRFGAPWGWARRDARPVGVMLHDTVFAVAYEDTSSCIGIVTNQGSGSSPWVFYALPGTNSTSENPSMFYDYFSWASGKIYVAYDNRNDADVHMSYWNYSSNQPSFSSPYTVSNASYASPNVAPSVTVDGNGRVHFAWSSFDHSRYYLNSIFHRSLSWAGFNWSTITQFVYYNPLDELSICGHSDASGGATIMFHRSDNNIYKVTSIDGINWNGGIGNPGTLITGNSAYPNLASRAYRSSVPYTLTHVNTTPYALSLGTRNENNGTGSVLYKTGPGGGKVLFYQVVQIEDTSRGLSAILTLSDINLITVDKQTVPASLLRLDSVAFKPLQGAVNSVSNASFDLALKVDSSAVPLSVTVALVDQSPKTPVMTIAEGSVSSSGTSSPSLFSANVPSSILAMNTRLAVVVNGKIDASAQMNLVNVYFLDDSSGSEENTPQASKHEVPVSFSLAQNYPNPFNPSTTIGYALPTSVHVILKVYDVLGREVKTLVDQFQAAGTYGVMIDASDLPSGVYFYRLSAGSHTFTKKLMLVK
jgi:Secretion system C-terminal sorting domain